MGTQLSILNSFSAHFKMNEYNVVNPIFGPIKDNLIQWSSRLARWALKVTVRIALITAAALLGSLFLTFAQTAF